MPELKSVPHSFTQKEQYSKYKELSPTRSQNKNELFKNNSGKSNLQFDFVTGKKSQQYEHITGESTELFHFDDTRSIKSSEASGSECDSGLVLEANSVNSDQPPFQPNKLTKKTRSRFKSEPILNKDFDSNLNTSETYKRRRFSTMRSKAKALSVCVPAGGQLEFSLLYDADEKYLTVTLVQLINIVLKPEIFLGTLDVYNKNDHQRSTKVHLIRKSDDTLQLSDYAETGFHVHVSLLPKRTFSRHTNVVFGDGSIIFNERFNINGYTLEQLSQQYLCMHVLCKFGRDCEPIVLGEVKVPMKRIQVAQVLPFVANLAQPEEELVLESYLKPATELGFLEIYLSFNPMAQTLVVKIIQATGLPKIGMTGSPNVSVKTALYYCNLRVSKKTTSIQKRQKEPVFNESFEFQLSKDRISECDVLFEIRHHGPMYRSVIGYVIVGNSAGGEGTKQWRQLLDFSYHEKVYKIMPNKPVGLS